MWVRRAHPAVWAETDVVCMCLCEGVQTVNEDTLSIYTYCDADRYYHASLFCVLPQTVLSSGTEPSPLFPDLPLLWN